MDTLWQDLRYGIRMLHKNSGFTAVAMLALALGIGANSAIFSVVNAVLFRPLPFDHPDQLVMVWETNRAKGIRQQTVSYPNFKDWKEQNHVFEELAVFRAADFTLTGVNEPERIEGARVSASFFPLLRVQAALGRTFRPEEDEAGAENVVMLSHGFWQRRFGGDSGLLGKTLTLGDRNFTVIGILPPGFKFPLEISTAEIWTPLALDAGYFPQRGALILHALARLKPGVTREQAQVEMEAIARRLEQQYPDYLTGRGVNLVPLHEQIVGDVRPALLILLGTVGLVLLIACANVANLLLARGAAREKELAVRAALGAGRWRLIQQLLTESILLAIAGGGLGLLVTLWGTEGLVVITPQDIPRANEIGVDGHVLGFTLVLSVLTGLVFGLVPALYGSRVQLHESLKEAGRTTTASGHHRLRSLLVVTEVGLAIVLLVGSGLLIRSFLHLLRVDPGFRPENVLTFQMSVSSSQYDDNQLANLYGEILERLTALPGVQSVGGSTSLPLGSTNLGIGFRILDRPEPPRGQGLNAQYDSITPDYFRTMGIPLLKGRFFTEQDRRGRPGAMIITETMARRYWPDENPLGQRIQLFASFGAEGEPESYEIVGVVGDVHQRGLDTETKSHMYVPYRQQTWPFIAFAMRTVGDPLELVGAARRQVAAVTKEEATFNFRSLEQYVADSVARRRFAMLLLGIFATVALVLAAVGIYGVMAYTVTQRTHEIGVRMALGAQTSDIMRLVVRQGMALTLIGVAIGLAASLALTRLMKGLLFGVSATDPLTFAVIALLLTLVALLACYVPARRAAKVDPMVALRYE